MIHFYLFPVNKKILISDLPLDKIKSKYGHRYEIINSIKDKSSLDIIKQRVLRSYSAFEVEEWFQKEKATLSEEARQKISLSKIGKPRDEETRRKISETLKGRSNFQGKRHGEQTKEVMSVKKLGNQHTKNYVWAHDPRGSNEVRVKDLKDIPPGYSKGRDYYSTESGLYYFKEANRNYSD